MATVAQVTNGLGLTEAYSGTAAHSAATLM